MKLPSSEPLPTSINDLPPARQRHIRRQPRAASHAERGILLDSLLDQTRPSVVFFLLSILGSMIFGLSLYFNQPVGLIFGLVAFPFLTPVFGLALFPHSHKLSHWIKSLISLFIPIILTFTAGVLAGYFQKTGQLDNYDIFLFSTPYWFDLAAVVFSTSICALILVRQGELPRKIAILLSYEILLPIAVAGFGFPLGMSALWPRVLLLGLGHLVLAITIAIFIFFALSFAPKGVTGWILTSIALLLTAALILGGFISDISDLGIPVSSNPLTKTTLTSTPPIQPSPSNTPTAKRSPTAFAVILTSTDTPTIDPSPTNTISPSSTPSPQPTTFVIVIDSTNGLVIRETPDFEAAVVGYANDGDSYEVLNQSISSNGSLWYLVESNIGELGWLLSSFVKTQTPIATENN